MLYLRCLSAAGAPLSSGMQHRQLIASNVTRGELLPHQLLLFSSVLPTWSLSWCCFSSVLSTWSLSCCLPGPCSAVLCCIVCSLLPLLCGVALCFVAAFVLHRWWSCSLHLVAITVSGGCHLLPLCCFVLYSSPACAQLCFCTASSVGSLYAAASVPVWACCPCCPLLHSL